MSEATIVTIIGKAVEFIIEALKNAFREGDDGQQAIKLIEDRTRELRERRESIDRLLARRFGQRD